MCEIYLTVIIILDLVVYRGAKACLKWDFVFHEDCWFFVQTELKVAGNQENVTKIKKNLVF